MPWLVNKVNLTLNALGGTVFAPAGLIVSLDPSSVIGDGDKQSFTIEDWLCVRAHIFLRRPTEALSIRITRMVGLGVNRLARLYFSWPFDYIVDENERVIGYLASSAPKVTPLSELLSSNTHLSYSAHLRIAQNLCTALNVAHHSGIVFGNLTLETVCVDPDSCRVFLDPGVNAQFAIDQRRIALCHVGVPEYLAPEIQLFLNHQGDLRTGRERFGSIRQGKRIIRRSSPARPVYSWETDLFSLGVIIFALLHGGKHPLSCVEKGKPGLRKLTDVPAHGQFNPRPLPMMAGVRPKTSLKDKSFSVPNYRLPWFRGSRAGRIYDGCFDPAAYQRQHRPSEDNWYRLLNRKSRGLKARFSKLVDRIAGKLRSVARNSATPATSPQMRRAIASQYPEDLAGSEPISSPRVFWRTTSLAAIGIGLCGITLAIALTSLLSNPHSIMGFHVSPIAIFGGAIAGMLIANLVGGKSRDLRGYKPTHYVASILCSFVCSGVCGVLVGGMFQ